MKKRTKWFLLFLSFLPLVLVIESHLSNDYSTDKTDTKIDVPSKSRYNQSKAKSKSIIGDWYRVSSNPNPKYRRKIVIDYVIYSFRKNGTVKYKQNSQGFFDKKVSTTVIEGTYKFDKSKNAFITRFDRGVAGTHLRYWRLLDEGKAITFYWENITHGHKRDENDLFVKKGSVEWERREKVSVIRR